MTKRWLVAACVINPAVTHPRLRADSSDDKPVLTADHLGSNQEPLMHSKKRIINVRKPFCCERHEAWCSIFKGFGCGTEGFIPLVQIHPVIRLNKVIKYEVMTWPDRNYCLLSLKQMFQLKKRRLRDTLNIMRWHKLHEPPSNRRLTFFTELLYRHHRITWSPTPNVTPWHAPTMWSPAALRVRAGLRETMKQLE